VERGFRQYDDFRTAPGRFADKQSQCVAIRGRLRKHRGVLDAGDRDFCRYKGLGSGWGLATHNAKKSTGAKKCEKNYAADGGLA
jgi:hypothetical protein